MSSRFPIGVATKNKLPGAGEREASLTDASCRGDGLSVCERPETLSRTRVSVHGGPSMAQGRDRFPERSGGARDCGVVHVEVRHGPDAASFEKASAADTGRPDHIVDTMAFMFETRAVIRPTRQALDSPQLQRDYHECWQGLRKRFAAQ